MESITPAGPAPTIQTWLLAVSIEYADFFYYQKVNCHAIKDDAAHNHLR
jgi:hypothetical protein